jgi:rubrerythrin
MTGTIDFAGLRPVDALDLAILIEDEARERYEDLADQMQMHNTLEAEHFFRAMAVNEARHGNQLRARRAQQFGNIAPSVRREMIWDVEAPGYDTVRALMTVRQAMDVALAAETKARDFFAVALRHVDDAEVRAMFEELLSEEEEHQRLVRAAMARLAPEAGTPPAESADDPVPQ